MPRRALILACILAALFVAAVVLSILLRPWLVAWLGGPEAVCRIPESEREVVAALNRERDRENDLKRDLAAISDRISAARAQCKPPAPPKPKQVEAPPPPDPPKAEHPPEPPKREPPKPRPKVAEAPPPPPTEDALPPPPEDPPPTPPDAPKDLPRERWDRKDITMLEGCWNRLSNMRIQDVRTRQVTGVRRWVMCFDRNGQGRQEINLDNGVTCRGRLNAQFQPNGQLSLDDQENIACADGSHVFRREGTCAPTSESEAECVTRQPAVNSPPLRTRFHR